MLAVGTILHHVIIRLSQEDMEMLHVTEDQQSVEVSKIPPVDNGQSFLEDIRTAHKLVGQQLLEEGLIPLLPATQRSVEEK